MSRFSHYLQPIRDLAVNWSVDIATELEDYLEELEDITISFDGGATSLNFAEAALLIQGSTCVYSKKVEFLYTLLYQTLDLIALRRSGSGASSIKADGGDDELVEITEPEFLLLDNLPESASIDLPAPMRSPWSRDVALLPQTPLAAVAAYPFNVDTPGAGAGAGFHMSSAAVHGSGALMLEERDHGAANKQLSQQSGGGDAFSPVPLPGSLSPGGSDGFSDGGGDFMDDGFGSLDDSGASTQAGGEGAPPGANGDDETMGDPTLVPQAAKGVRFGGEVNERAAAFDPWAPLDPHAEEPSLARPFRKGKTTRAPKAKAAQAADVSAATRMLDQLSAPLSSLVGTYLPEFGSFQQQETRRRAAAGALARKNKPQPPAAAVSMEDDEDDGYDGGGGFFDDFGVFDDDDVEPQSLDDSLTLESVVKSFEELCREHIEATMRQAEDMASDDGVTSRVSVWQTKLEPLMKAEERRETFDIHKIGSGVVGSFQEEFEEPIGKTVQFQQMAQGKQLDRVDVCRMFASCMQLANTGNVLLSKSDDALQLQLLSLNTEHETTKSEPIFLQQTVRRPPDDPLDKKLKAAAGEPDKAPAGTQLATKTARKATDDADGAEPKRRAKAAPAQGSRASTRQRAALVDSNSQETE